MKQDLASITVGGSSKPTYNNCKKFESTQSAQNNCFCSQDAVKHFDKYIPLSPWLKQCNQQIKIKDKRPLKGFGVCDMDPSTCTLPVIGPVVNKYMLEAPNLDKCRSASKGLGQCFCLPETNENLVKNLKGKDKNIFEAWISTCYFIANHPLHPQPQALVASNLFPSTCAKFDADQCTDATDKIPAILAAGPANTGTCAQARKDLKMCLCMQSTLDKVLTGTKSSGLRGFADKCENQFKIPIGLAGDRACKSGQGTTPITGPDPISTGDNTGKLPNPISKVGNPRNPPNPTQPGRRPERRPGPGKPGTRPARTKPLPKALGEKNEECFTCACGLEGEPIPLEGICPISNAATANNSTTSSAACEAPENAKYKDEIKTGASVCSCMKKAYSYASKQGKKNGTVSMDFIDFRTGKEVSRAERMESLKAATDLSACLDQAGYVPSNNLTQVLTEYEGASAPGLYTYSSLTTNVMELDMLTKEGNCSAGSKNGDWQSSCAPLLEVLIPPVLDANIFPPIMKALKQVLIGEVVGNMQLESLESIVESEDTIPLDTTCTNGTADFQKAVEKIIVQFAQLGRKVDELKQAEIVLSGAIADSEIQSEPERINSYITFLEEEVGLPKTLPSEDNKTTNYLGSEFALWQTEGAIPTAEDLLLKGGFSDLAQMLRELEKAAQLLQTSSSSLASECRDFPEEDQQAIEALAASVKAARSAMDDVDVKLKQLEEDKSNVTDLEIVQYAVWYELDMSLPCVNKPKKGGPAYPTVKEMCQHQAVVIMPQESITVLKTLDLGSPPLNDSGILTAADMDFGDEEGGDEEGDDYGFEYADDEDFFIEADANEDQPDPKALVALTNFEKLEELEIPLYDDYDEVEEDEGNQEDEGDQEDNEAFRNKVSEEP